METARAHGPAAVRRRGLRQDRGCPARGDEVRAGRASRRPSSCPPPSWPSSTIRPPCSAFAASRSKIGVLSPLPHARRRCARRSPTCAAGKCDLVIGTHRLLQKDVEVQGSRPAHRRRGAALRRGAQGARSRRCAEQVDVLTLSATPIPRTLNMALSGIRDMSTIEEPPQDRHPVQTYVHGARLRRARRRHAPGAASAAARCTTCTTGWRASSAPRGPHPAAARPDAAVGVAHGKMNEEELSDVMERMADGRDRRSWSAPPSSRRASTSPT